MESLLDDNGSGDEKEFLNISNEPENNHHLRHHKHLKMEVTMMQQAMEAMEAKLEREVRWLKQNYVSINSTLNAVSRRTDFMGNQTTTLNRQQLDLTKQIKESETRSKAVEQEIWDTKEELRNVTEIITVVDKLHSSTLKLFEALEVLEDRFDKSIQDLQREVSKSDFNLGQMQSSFEILREDQNDHYGVLKTLRKDYSVLKMEVQRDHYRLLSVQNEVLNQSLQECKANNKELLQDVKLENLEHKLGKLQTQVTNNHFKMAELDTHVKTKIDKPFLSSWVKRQEEMKQEIRNISTNLPQLKSFYSDLKTEISKFVDLLPHDCSMDQDTTPPVQYKSGVYLIHPQGTESAFPIYCDMDTAGGRWTVIQRRKDGSQDFYRPWEDYKQGFGDPAGEYWLGNELIHQITTSDNYTLRLDMWDTYGHYTFAEYDLFYVENETDNYRLMIGGYHGNATDAMENHNRMAFSTNDRDNDASSTHCAVYYSSGWWYNHCQYVNINGRYNIGLTWYNMDQHEWVQLTKVEMKLRPSRLREL
ncbi:angiopoietin-related protein 7-like [Limulus polyphemus]|uniref:Angiopoietin-related protein 7-like n=1 Tax=Limulus polyphemus TaxID=6850 RepID=A0ABM1BU56_LIMPO|nr:angiopoietin-related protein 7-like [Limulus polyphemus]